MLLSGLSSDFATYSPTTGHTVPCYINVISLLHPISSPIASDDSFLNLAGFLKCCNGSLYFPVMPLLVPYYFPATPNQFFAASYGSLPYLSGSLQCSIVLCLLTLSSR